MILQIWSFLLWEYSAYIFRVKEYSWMNSLFVRVRFVIILVLKEIHWLSFSCFSMVSSVQFYAATHKYAEMTDNYFLSVYLHYFSKCTFRTRNWRLQRFFGHIIGFVSAISSETFYKPSYLVEKSLRYCS